MSSSSTPNNLNRTYTVRSQPQQGEAQYPQSIADISMPSFFTDTSMLRSVDEMDCSFDFQNLNENGPMNIVDFLASRNIIINDSSGDTATLFSDSFSGIEDVTMMHFSSLDSTVNTSTTVCTNYFDLDDSQCDLSEVGFHGIEDVTEPPLLDWTANHSTLDSTEYFDLDSTLLAEETLDMNNNDEPETFLSKINRSNNKYSDPELASDSSSPHLPH